MLHRSTLALASLLSLSTLASQAQTLNTAKLDSLLNSLAANNKMMGSVAFSHAGQVVYSRACGAAQLVPARPATPATHYRVGSISKMFTATMVMQLIEEKKLTLATPLATFFPQLPNAQAVTIDQLLSHRSGLHNFTSDAAFAGYMTQPKTPAELLAIIGQAPPDFEPGAKYAYSNSNYVVLSYIIEQLTKLPYAQALQKRVVAKAGLKNTYYGGRIDAARQEAASYRGGASGWQLMPETDMSIPSGAGAIVSTPADLDRFLEALFGGQLVSAASLDAMKTIRDTYGRGLMLIPFGPRQSYGHGGSIDGFLSMASYFPADKVAVAVCTNGQQYPLNDLMIGILSIYFGQPYKIPDFAAPAYVPAPADLDRYAGTYACPQLPVKVTFTREGTTLRSQATGQGAFALEPVSPGVFKFDQAGIRVEFDAAQPTFTLLQGGGKFVFTKE